MSFVGQFGPTITKRKFRLSPGFVVFAISFVVSSSLSVFVLSRLGTVVSLVLTLQQRLAIAVASTAVLCSFDLWMQRRRSCSIGPLRQTSQRLRFNVWAPLVWGLDTGVPFTTVRTTLLPVACTLLTILDFGTQIGGVFYAFGFIVSVWIWSYRYRLSGNGFNHLLELRSKAPRAARQAQFIVATVLIVAASHDVSPG